MVEIYRRISITGNLASFRTTASICQFMVFQFNRYTRLCG